MHTREGREIKALRKRIEFLKEDLADANKTIAKEREDRNKWRDKYAMLMSVVKPLVDKVRELTE